jgi:hypothetical protein
MVLRHSTLFSCILAVLNSPTIFLRKGFSFFQQALIKIKSLSDKIDGRSNRSDKDKENNPFTSDDLALQLIQGAKKVSFKARKK